MRVLVMLWSEYQFISGIPPLLEVPFLSLTYQMLLVIDLEWVLGLQW
jgi:hypothetical protein